MMIKDKKILVRGRKW